MSGTPRVNAHSRREGPSEPSSSGDRRGCRHSVDDAPEYDPLGRPFVNADPEHVLPYGHEPSGDNIFKNGLLKICDISVPDLPPVSNPGGPYSGNEGSNVSFNGSGSTGKAAVLEGFRFLRSWKGALILILMIMVINLLFTPAMTLMPLLVTSYFGMGVVEFATMEMVVGASFILGGIALSAWGGFKRKVVTMLVSGVLAGIGVVLVGIVPPGAFYVAVGGMFLAGFMIAMLNGSAQAVMQSSIPPDKQGRVFGLMGSLTVAVTPIALVVAGPVSDLFGVQIWFVVAGLCLSVVMAGGFFMPSVMNVEDIVSQKVAVEER